MRLYALLAAVTAVSSLRFSIATEQEEIEERKEQSELVMVTQFLSGQMDPASMGNSLIEFVDRKYGNKDGKMTWDELKPVVEKMLDFLPPTMAKPDIDTVEAFMKPADKDSTGEYDEEKVKELMPKLVELMKIYGHI